MAMKKFKMLNLICESCTLTSKEKLVAQYFVYKSNKKGECYPSVETIASHCGVSERTVQRATKKLKEKDYISIEVRYYKGRQSSNEYRLNAMLIDGMGEESGGSGECNEIALDMEVINLEAVLLQSELVKGKVDQYDGEEIEVKNMVQDELCEGFDYDDLDMGLVNFTYNISGKGILDKQRGIRRESFAVIVGLNIKQLYLVKMSLFIKQYESLVNFEKVYFIKLMRYSVNNFRIGELMKYYKINVLIFKIANFISFLGVSW